MQAKQINFDFWAEVASKVRGKLRDNVSLANRTWFRVGGDADFLFSPEDEQDLCAFLQMLPIDVPVTIIGVGSNLLVRDGGIEGVVIRLGRNFAEIVADGSTIIAGAGALDVNVAKIAAENGIAGFEFLAGIPGTIGGAVRMNAGAYGCEIAQFAKIIHAVDRSGQKHVVEASAAGFSYRHCGLPDDWIIIKVEMCGKIGSIEQINERIQEIMKHRSDSQPVRARTGGSTFKNPPAHKAWELIDASGCRGMRLGDAQVSELHCNFLLNCNSASAQDLEGLGEQVRRKVLQHSGVELEWEIKRIGRFA